MNSIRCRSGEHLAKCVTQRVANRHQLRLVDETTCFFMARQGSGTCLANAHPKSRRRPRRGLLPRSPPYFSVRASEAIANHTRAKLPARPVKLASALKSPCAQRAGK